MVLRTDDERALFTGVRCINGRWYYTYSDGFKSLALSGGDGEGDGGDGGGDGEGEGDGEGGDGDDDDEEEDDDDPKTIKDPKLRAASQEAAKYRVQRNKARTERDDATTKLGEANTKIADLEKQIREGVTDEKSKEMISTLQGDNKTLTDEVADLKTKLKDAEGKITTTTIDAQVEKAVGNLKVKETAKLVRRTLQEEEMLEVDEDGTVENLERNIRKLIKRGELSVVSDDEEDEDTSNGDGGRASGTTKSSGKVPGVKKKTQGTLDQAALAKKYPALRNR